MTYTEFISQFEVFENPPKKDGYDRHHIVPKSEQTEPDERQIYVSLPMHMWLHILYDRENGTNTAKRFLSTCRKPIEYFDCWEKCLAYSYTLRKKEEERIKKLAEVMKTTEYRQKISESLKGLLTGEKNPMFGQHHTEETCKQISETLKGKNAGEKHPFYGQHHTEEARRKMSKNHSDCFGDKNPAYGRHWYTNGEVNFYGFECPGEGWSRGRLTYTKS